MGWWRSTDAQKKEGKTLKLSLSLSLCFFFIRRVSNERRYWLCFGLQKDFPFLKNTIAEEGREKRDFNNKSSMRGAKTREKKKHYWEGGGGGGEEEEEEEVGV